MADLVVRADLADLVRDLNKLIGEFKGALDLEHDTGRVWGQHNANLSMNDFADNWTAHRDEMVVDMEKLRDTVQKVHDSWHDVDTQLADIGNES